MRLFFASDIHGSERCYRKFINTGKFYKADAIILGGDITGKTVVPIVERNDGTYSMNYLGRETIVRKGQELDQEENRIRDMGYYTRRTNEEELEELNSSESKLHDLFTSLMLQTLQRWMEYADTKLRDSKIACFVLPGNDDQFEVDAIIDRCEAVVNPEGRVLKIGDGHEMVATGYANLTPWRCPRDVTEPELRARIETMINQVQDMRECVFVTHCPPFNTKLDVAPKLDKDLRPELNPGGQQIMIPAGSVAIRELILTHQPLIGLHGHIHESMGMERLGKTMCLNPGSEYGEGILRGAIVNIEKGRVRTYQLISG